MSKRISHSWLDPWITLPFKRLYPWLPIPRWFPPEGIVASGHLLAAAGGIGFAYSTQSSWGGALAAICVTGNHFADVFDGTHARATQQCRNGGELLDHFTDPISFAYWISGMAFSIDRLDLGLAGVVCLFASAVLTNIKAKMIGEFTLASFGPTEFKTLLVLYATGLMGGVGSGFGVSHIRQCAYFFYCALLVIGFLQLAVNLWTSVKEVNARGAPADTSDWTTTREQESMQQDP